MTNPFIIPPHHTHHTHVEVLSSHPVPVEHLLGPLLKRKGVGIRDVTRNKSSSHWHCCTRWTTGSSRDS